MKYEIAKLDPEVRAAWERGEARACSNCGSKPDDWACEPDHCHSCLAGASTREKEERS